MTDAELDAAVRRLLHRQDRWWQHVGPGWPTERGWLTIALFVQTAAIIALIAWIPELRKDEFFKAIANAIIVTGWIGFAVGQRQNSEDRKQVGAAIETMREQARSIPNADEPLPVTVANSTKDPVPTVEAK